MFRKTLGVLLVLFMLLPSAAMAEENLDLGQWAQLPILHEGRLKPIDSFARIHLKKLSGQTSINNQSANQWLAEVLFAPDQAALRPTFKIRNFKQYGLSEKKFYSYVDVTEALNKKKALIDDLLKSNVEKFTPEQQSLISLHNKANIYAQLLRALTALLPLNIETVENQTYLNLKNNEGSPKILKLIEAGGFNNTYFRIIPPTWENMSGEWIAPWEALKENNTNDASLAYLSQWSALANAYRDYNQEAWDQTVSALPSTLVTTRLKTEYLYNLLKLLLIAGGLYAFSFSLIVIDKFTSKVRLNSLAFSTLILGVIANGLDIGLRIYILERPPVGTLYESIIFVSFICVLGCLLLERKYKDQTGLLLGSILGGLLLITAKSFAGDDTMNTLVAVLNTNFWLLTHVICITIGYAVCFITSIIAHYYLVVKLVSPIKKNLLKQLKTAVKTLIIISLLFTTIGTILGGIWADQSWGRFWGWDPKENGALLIVLWLIWLLHGKISKHINETGFMVGAAFLSIIVVIAWFGVNLLSVGLHSYGFISGVAFGITLFCLIEFLIISGLWFFGRQKAITS